MILVYLAGPITGLTYDDANNWRLYARQKLDEMSHGLIRGVSPMRHKEYLSAETILGDTYDDTVLSSQRGIYGRDLFDCARCTGMIVNFVGATEVSKGTLIEIGAVGVLNKPIILAMEPGNIHEHAMAREAARWRVSTLDAAIETAVKVLMP